jgi:hypothetical protein
MSEVWKVIEGWPFHQVSNLGRVRVLPGGKIKRRTVRKIEQRKLTVMGEGYVTVRSGVLVHRLVLIAFRGPADGRQSRHRDGSRANNRLSNLRWGTRKQNEADKIGHGRTNRGARNGQAKLSPRAVEHIRRATGPRGIITALAELHGVSHGTVSMIRAGKRWADENRSKR